MTIEERAKEYAQAYDPKESAVQYAVERAYGIGATDQDPISREAQKKIDIEKLKDIMNRLMLDTKDKAEIIKAMEE